MKFKYVLVPFLMTYASAFAAEVLPSETDPVKIMSAVEKREEGDRSRSVMAMEVVDDQGRRRSRTLTAWMKHFDEGRKQLMIFNAPADVAGTGLLSLDYNDGARADDQWLYLPSLKKSTRISSGEKSGSFMGTDLTYSDMTQSDPNDYQFKLLKDEVMVGNEPCWLIESRPASARVKRRNRLSKIKDLGQQD